MSINIAGKAPILREILYRNTHAWLINSINIQYVLPSTKLLNAIMNITSIMLFMKKIENMRKNRSSTKKF